VKSHRIKTPKKDMIRHGFSERSGSVIAERKVRRASPPSSPETGRELKSAKAMFDKKKRLIYSEWGEIKHKITERAFADMPERLIKISEIYEDTEDTSRISAPRGVMYISDIRFLHKLIAKRWPASCIVAAKRGISILQSRSRKNRKEGMHSGCILILGNFLRII